MVRKKKTRFHVSLLPFLFALLHCWVEKLRPDGRAAIKEKRRQYEFNTSIYKVKTMVDLNIIEWYFSQGLELIPLKTGEAGKEPRDFNWQHIQYSDERLRECARRFQNVGWRITDPHFVFDVDPRHNGWLSLMDLEVEYPEIAAMQTETPIVITGSGGLHVYLKAPREGMSLRGHIPGYPGIDIKKVGGQVVIPGSVHPDTKQRYVFKDGTPKHPIRTAPDALIALIERPEVTPGCDDDFISAETLKLLLDQIPVEEYASDALWFPLLASAAHATEGATDALDVFLEWSLSDPRYSGEAKRITDRWYSITRSGTAGRTVGTLVFEAQKHGGPGLDAARIESAKELIRLNPIEANPTPEIGLHMGVTQWGLSECIVDEWLRKNKLQLCLDSGENFMCYTGSHWVQISNSSLRRQVMEYGKLYCQEHAVKKAGASTIIQQGMVYLGAVTPENPGLWDANQSEDFLLVNCRNGTIEVDMRSGDSQLKAHDPADGLTSLLGADFDIYAQCPLFDHALEGMFRDLPDRDQVIEYLWEVIGYILQPIKNLAAWFLLKGSGSDGKSVVLQVISALLGAAATHRDLADFSTDHHATAGLVGKLVLIDDDLKAGFMLRDDLLKKITEPKILTANPKNQKPFDFLVRSTVLMASNTWPQTHDISHGMLRRAKIIPFPRRFDDDEKDIYLADTVIKSELSGILRKALGGLLNLRTRGRFAIPPSCVQAFEDWRRNANPVLNYVETHYDLTGDAKDKIGVRDVWEGYKAWCLDSGIHYTVTRIKFLDLLQGCGWKIQPIRKVQNFVGVRRNEGDI